jgi:hypothetical protein
VLAAFFVAYFCIVRAYCIKKKSKSAQLGGAARFHLIYGGFPDKEKGRLYEALFFKLAWIL